MLTIQLIPFFQLFVVVFAFVGLPILAIFDALHDNRINTAIHATQSNSAYCVIRKGASYCVVNKSDNSTAYLSASHTEALAVWSYLTQH